MSKFFRFDYSRYSPEMNLDRLAFQSQKNHRANIQGNRTYFFWLYRKRELRNQHHDKMLYPIHGSVPVQLYPKSVM